MFIVLIAEPMQSVGAYLRVFHCQMTRGLCKNIVRSQLQFLVLAQDLEFFWESLEVHDDIIGVEEPNISLTLAKAILCAIKAVVFFLDRQGLAEILIIVWPFGLQHKESAWVKVAGDTWGSFLLRIYLKRTHEEQRLIGLRDERIF